jgi:predicted XRE-type DNA-binding protein
VVTNLSSIVDAEHASDLVCCVRVAEVSEGEEIELVHGSGNVFRDFGDANADLEQARVILASQIVTRLDAKKLSTRAAEALTGVGASEFSRIRGLKLSRFTLDRLISILGRLDADAEVRIDVRRRRRAA